MAKSLLGCSIRDGKSASFWCDDWSPLGCLLDLFGNNGPLTLGIPLHASVSDAATTQGWKLPSARTRNHNSLALRNYMLTVQPPAPHRGSDCFTWGVPNSRKNTFSTKLTWSLLRPAEHKKPWSPAVWFKCSVPRHSFTFWIANLDRLPVRSRLVQWGMNISPTCLLCNQYPETRDHLLLHCPFSETLWSKVLHRFGIQAGLFADWNSLISWLMSKSPRISTTLKRIASQATVYLIWRQRNDRLHNSVSATPESVFKSIDRTIRDTLLARRSRKGCCRLLSQWFTYS